MMKKRAQGLSINAVILIILGLAVLVILALGFIIGWNKLLPWIGPSNNVDTVSSACETACVSQNLFNYCSLKRELNDGNSTYKNITCYTLGILPSFVNTYGIKSCSNLNCNVKCDSWEYTSSNVPNGGRVILSGVTEATGLCR
jgi:hypothetical protein